LSKVFLQVISTNKPNHILLRNSLKAFTEGLPDSAIKRPFSAPPPIMNILFTEVKPFCKYLHRSPSFAMFPDLTKAEIQSRGSNRLKRRIMKVKFLLIKPLETFDLQAVPDLDIRVFSELAACEYIKASKHDSP